jgi:hypothetical protein
MKAKFTRIQVLLIFLLSAFFCSNSFAYIIRVSIFQNPSTGHHVVLFWDHHSVGTQLDNKIQMNRFINKIVDFSETRGIPINIYIEASERFSINFKSVASAGVNLSNPNWNIRQFRYTDKRAKVVLHCYYPHPFNLNEFFSLDFIENMNENKNNQRQTTWLGNIHDHIYRSSYQSVAIHSVDPRFTIRLWKNRNFESIASLKDLFSINDIQKYKFGETYKTLLLKNDLLSQELKKIDDQSEFDKAQLKKHFPLWTQESEQDFLSNFNQGLLDKGLVTKNSLEEVKADLKSNTFYFLSALDKLAFLEIARSQSEGRSALLLLGGVHAANLESHLINLGYNKQYETPSDNQFVPELMKIVHLYSERHELRDASIKFSQRDLDTTHPKPKRLGLKIRRDFSRVAQRLGKISAK